MAYINSGVFFAKEYYLSKNQKILCISAYKRMLSAVIF